MGPVFVAVFIVLLILKITGVAADLSWWWVWSPFIVYVGIIVALFGFIKLVFFPSAWRRRLREKLKRWF